MAGIAPETNWPNLDKVHAQINATRKIECLPCVVVRNCPSGKKITYLRAAKPFIPVKARFLTSVQIGALNECWEWTGSINSEGYGNINIGKTEKAHRFSYLAFHGKIDPLKVVCHKCDNPPCVNPHHLFLGTREDNLKDCIAKGRAKYSHGESHRLAKLTSKDVLVIRELLSKRSQLAIAKKFGVSDKSISNIKKNRTWKHVPRSTLAKKQ